METTEVVIQIGCESVCIRRDGDKYSVHRSDTHEVRYYTEPDAAHIRFYLAVAQVSFFANRVTA